MAAKYPTETIDASGIPHYFLSNIEGLVPIPPRAGSSQVQVFKHTSNPTKSWSILKLKVRSDKVVPTSPDTPKPPGHTRVVCLSDTHDKTDNLKVPLGDILIHAGDFTQKGLPREVTKFNDFLRSLPHKYKIVIAGNHDISFEADEYAASLWRQFSHPEKYDSIAVKRSLKDCIYLEDCGVEVMGLKIFGSPWQPEFHKWGFNLPRGAPILAKWDQIPEGVDILITHGPPIGQRDQTFDGIRSGCVELLTTVRERVKPRYHVFGHIHEAYGVTTDGHTQYVNASTCTLKYKPINPPVILDIPDPV